jgi:hypothetical protein
MNTVNLALTVNQVNAVLAALGTLIDTIKSQTEQQLAPPPVGAEPSQPQV